MTNAKNTKRALVSSLLALVLCVSMLIGSTYAWFTDTATTGVNTIQSGTLRVALEYSTDGVNWQDAENKTLDFQKAAGHEDEDILWEPGCTYELPAIRVRNDGNLALKYQIVINGVTGDAKLLEAIEFTANDEDIATYGGHLNFYNATSDSIVIKGHMKEEADNKYQGLTLEGIGITVYATQYADEYDSYNNTYDINAEYEGYEPPVPTADLTFEEGPIVVDSIDAQGIEGTTTMDGIYTFTAKEDYHSALAGGYDDWLCDYYISFDNDVLDGAGAIGGSYEGWKNGKWLILGVPSGGIKANTEIALLDNMLNGLSIGTETEWTYAQVCLAVQQFKCGVVAEHEESLNGTTMTVELRMTNPDDGTVEVIEHIEYTFK